MENVPAVGNTLACQCCDWLATWEAYLTVKRLNVKVYLRQKASVGCRKVGMWAYCKVQLSMGELSDLPISRVCVRSCGANPGGLCTPPTAVRWDPRQLQKVKDKVGMYGCISKENVPVRRVPVSFPPRR